MDHDGGRVVEEWGTGVDAIGAASRRTRRRSGRRWVCGDEMAGFVFRGSGTPERRIVAMGVIDYVNTLVAKEE
jgi:hypothetical protein